MLAHLNGKTRGTSVRMLPRAWAESRRAPERGELPSLVETFEL